MKVAALILVAVILAGLGWIRLAPSDPARWHVSPGGAEAPTPVTAEAGSARATLLLADVTPAEALARLDAIAAATPRTARLAGSPEEGRITWITRTQVFGFPDYTTAEAQAVGTDTRVQLYARLRFGGSDLGVNAARLEDWVARLTGSPP